MNASAGARETTCGPRIFSSRRRKCSRMYSQFQDKKIGLYAMTRNWKKIRRRRILCCYPFGISPSTGSPVRAACNRITLNLRQGAPEMASVASQVMLSPVVAALVRATWTMNTLVPADACAAGVVCNQKVTCKSGGSCSASWMTMAVVPSPKMPSTRSCRRWWANANGPMRTGMMRWNSTSLCSA